MSATLETKTASLSVSALTQGSVLFAGANGTVSQDNAQIFWDDTNFRLGVGTASPSQLLHINVSGTNASVMQFSNTTTGNLAQVYATNTKGLVLGTNGGGTSAITLDSSGNVGVGTTPTSHLDIRGSNSAGSTISGANTGAGSWSLSNQGAAGSSRLAIGADGTSVGTAERISIIAEGANAGNVGIGTTSPGSLFVVYDGTKNILDMAAWTTFSTTPGGFSGTPTQACRYKLVGKTCFYQISISGTSNATSFTFTLPFAANNVVASKVAASVVDNSAAVSGAGMVITALNSTTANAYTSMRGDVWTNVGTKSVDCVLIYEIA